MLVLTMREMLERVEERLKIEFGKERALKLCDLIKNKNEDNEWQIKEEVFSILEGIFFEETAVKYLKENKYQDDVVTADITCFIRGKDDVRILLIQSSYSSETDEVAIDGSMTGRINVIELNNEISTEITFNTHNSLDEMEDDTDEY